MENTGMDRDLGNGSIQRFNPRTGRPRIISGADAARTALTRERDAEESRKAGAPPIATGARGSQAPTFDATAAERQRLVSLASMRPDRNITPETVARATPEQVRGELSAIGTDGRPAGRQQGTAVAPKTAGTAPTFDASRYQTNDRAQNVARAKADGQFDSMQARFNANNTGAQMDKAGQIVRNRPAAAPTFAPSDPNNPDSPLVPTTPQGGSARPAAPKAPDYGARQDGNVTRNNFGDIINPATGMVNVAADNADFVRSRPLFGANIAMATGPNISVNDPRNPNTLPAGSIGAQSANGTYSVELADGTKRSFANEAAARAGFTAPPAAAPAPAAPMTPPPAPAPAPATATESGMAPAFTAKGIGQRVVAGVGQLATDQTAANPANFIDTAERYGTAAVGALWNGQWNVPEKGLIRQGVEAINEAVPIAGMIGSAIGDARAQTRQREAIAAGRIAPDFNQRAARAQAARNATGSTIAPTASASPVPVGTPSNSSVPTGTGPQARRAQQNATAIRDGNALDAQQKRRMRAPVFGETLDPDLDAGSVPPPVPIFDDDEPAAFPPLSRSATRPRANLMAFA